MPLSDDLEALGRLLVQLVRDETIRELDRMVDGRDRSIFGQRWANLGAGQQHELLAALLPDAVDHTISVLLTAIDQGLLPLLVRTADGRTVDLVEHANGELSGEYLGRDGWRQRYGVERATDFTAELGLDLDGP